MKRFPSGVNFLRKQGGFSTLTRVKLGTMFRWNPLEVFRDLRLMKITNVLLCDVSQGWVISAHYL